MSSTHTEGHKTPDERTMSAPAQFKKAFHSQLYRQSNKPVIIHRTKVSMISSETEEQRARRLKRERERGERGWNAPESKTYQPLGDFEDVIYPVEAVKFELPDARDMDVETVRNIKLMKRK